MIAAAGRSSQAEYLGTRAGLRLFRGRAWPAIGGQVAHAGTVRIRTGAIGELGQATVSWQPRSIIGCAGKNDEAANLGGLQ